MRDRLIFLSIQISLCLSLPWRNIPRSAKRMAVAHIGHNWQVYFVLIGSRPFVVAAERLEKYFYARRDSLVNRVGVSTYVRTYVRRSNVSGSWAGNSVTFLYRVRIWWNVRRVLVRARAPMYFDVLSVRRRAAPSRKILCVECRLDKGEGRGGMPISPLVPWKY